MAETTHIVKSFEQELNKLRDLITEMGGMVESQVAAAAQAVVHGDRRRRDRGGGAGSEASMRSSARSSSSSSACSRCASRWRWICARSSPR